MDIEFIRRISRLGDRDIQVIFKPKQQEVLTNIMNGKPLNENQKRYLRGDVGRKIDILSKLAFDGQKDDLLSFLDGIENYYITGYYALKKNGYGWYFDVKRITVLNTRIEGTYHLNGKIIKLKRYRSIRNRSFQIDPRSGLKIATNKQILQDAIENKDEALIRECGSHLRRYGKLFMENHEGLLIEKENSDYDPEDFGV